MPSFKTINFRNETGLNLIVANQKNPGKSDKGDTTNGVGKSMLIAIIHFCLGSSSKKSFQKQLSNWEFCLEFKIDNHIYISKRNCTNQNIIKLNDEDLSIKDFKNKLEHLLFFAIPNNFKELTFRSLLSFFIRPRKASYNSETNPNAINLDYQIQLNNAYLLGLDIQLANEKYELKNEKDRIKQLLNDLKNDKFIHDFFVGNKDISLVKSELNETISLLEKDLNNFEVAEDYYEIKEQADNLKSELENLHNDIFLNQLQINNIDDSIKISPDLKKENIEKIYNEASVLFNPETIKKLSELEKFYKHIAANREKRLIEQKNKLLSINVHLHDLKKTKEVELNSKLKYLDAHQALDVFTSLTNKLSDAKSKKENLLMFEDLLAKYKEETRKIEKKLIESTDRTNQYIQYSENHRKDINDFFRSIIKRIYPKVNSYITIYNNDSDNKIRYDIKAKIDDDKSDGINNVKIFSYDLTLLLKGFGHKVNFLFHDSRILDGIAPRQKYELFLILNEYIKSNFKQYILTVNYNQLEEIKPFFSELDYENIISNNIILELKDNSPEDKLLGIQLDIDYD